MSVNGFWTGGYENTCRWHTKLMKMAETEPMPLVEFLLGVLFAILAIVVKLRITADLYGPRHRRGHSQPGCDQRQALVPLIDRRRTVEANTPATPRLLGIPLTSPPMQPVAWICESLADGLVSA